jgi:cytochrome P450
LKEDLMTTEACIGSASTPAFAAVRNELGSKQAGVARCPYAHSDEAQVDPPLPRASSKQPASATPLPRASEAPRVPGLPGLGSALALLRDPYGWWPTQYRRFGSVFRVTLPIEGRTWITIAGRDANELMARHGQRIFSQKMTYPKAEKVLGTDLHPSITEGELQRHLRRQIAPGFSRQALGPHLPAMTDAVRRYVDGWKAGRSINVTDETSQLGLECISHFATGQPLGCDAGVFRNYATVFTGVIAMSWPMALMRAPSVRRAREQLDAMIVKRLREHAQVPPGDGRAADYFDFLAKGTLPDGSPLPEREQVVFGQIPFKNMGVYAGRVINHVLYQLVHRPEVLARVQPEIDRVLGQDDVTLEGLDSMKALRATISETLRILPIAVALQRTVCEPFDFGGYRFEVGDRVFTPISATHFLPEYFPDPMRFDIDRFDSAQSESRPSFVYNPFGLGHHGCVARAIFEPITTLIVGTVLQRWRLEANYRLRTIIDALPGPWPFHRMQLIERRHESMSSLQN